MAAVVVGMGLDDMQAVSVSQVAAHLIAVEPTVVRAVVLEVAGDTGLADRGQFAKADKTEERIPAEDDKGHRGIQEPPVPQTS